MTACRNEPAGTLFRWRRLVRADFTDCRQAAASRPIEANCVSTTGRSYHLLCRDNVYVVTHNKCKDNSLGYRANLATVCRLTYRRAQFLEVSSDLLRLNSPRPSRMA